MGTRIRQYATQVAQGEGWSRACTYRVDNAAETPISLVGARVQFLLADPAGDVAISYDVTQGGAASDAVEFTDAAAGQFAVTITGAETAPLEPGRYTMELWITLAGGEPARLLPLPSGGPATLTIRATVRS